MAHHPQPPMPLNTPVTKTNVLAAIVESIHETSMVLAAWSRFGDDWAAFVESEPGLSERFEAFRTARKSTPER